MRRATTLAVLGLAVLTVPPSTAPAQDSPLQPPPAYYRPVITDGMTFPVARSNWHSVITFGRDWHDPRFRMIGGRWRLAGVHEGNDIISEEGTPIHSMTSGVVEAVGWTFYSGTRVGVRGTDGRYYFYAHLSEVALGVAAGSRVEAGTVLGRVGNTGYGDPGTEDEFPPHLHLGIMEGGSWVDPYPTVRRLYRESVQATTRGERRLARLMRNGDTERYERLAERLYAETEE